MLGLSRFEYMAVRMKEKPEALMKGALQLYQDRSNEMHQSVFCS